MDATLEAALRPPDEPSFYRRLAWIPSVRTVGDTLLASADHWRGEAEWAVAQDRPALVVLGDSLAQGVGASAPAQSYVGRLREHLGDTGPLPVLNLSRSGAQIADVLDVQLPAFRDSGVVPHAVVCTVGSNDIRHTFHLDQVRSAFVTLIGELPGGTALATLPEKGSRVAASMNRTIRKLAPPAGLAVADVGLRLQTWRGRISGDGFHPNDAGHRVWFEAFAEAMSPGR
ncbi:MAG TPA: SGNH/GDSL hydrolase family protein [Microthrixaceae bacterium]|nr:SGNH/GDSL hydrolase family protein [Microthrixaceae bacterium]HNI35980.1 SGNH/GDSL hydrolase family protein [Microthrixaceae bacterium]